MAKVVELHGSSSRPKVCGLTQKASHSVTELYPFLMTPMIVYCPPSLSPLKNELTAALWISDEPVAPFGLKLCSCERQESRRSHPSHSEFTSRCSATALFKLVKGWYTENDIKLPAFQARRFICHGTGSCT